MLYTSEPSQQSSEPSPIEWTVPPIYIGTRQLTTTTFQGMAKFDLAVQLGRRDRLSGHFDVAVVLEDARKLGADTGDPRLTPSWRATPIRGRP